MREHCKQPARWPQGVALAALAALAMLSACNTSSSHETRAPQPSPAETSKETVEPATGHTPSAEKTMQQDALLEDGAILLFEKVSLGNEAEANRRWKLTEDGTVWFSRNRPPVPRDREFNQPFEPLATLSEEQRQTLLDTARQAGFWDAPDKVEDPAVEDGMQLRLTIRDKDKTKRITADNAKSEPIEAITAALFEML